MQQISRKYCHYSVEHLTKNTGLASFTALHGFHPNTVNAMVTNRSSRADLPTLCSGVQNKCVQNRYCPSQRSTRLRRQGWQAEVHCTGFAPTPLMPWPRPEARAYLPTQCSGVQNKRVQNRYCPSQRSTRLRRQGWQAEVHCTGFIPSPLMPWPRTEARAYLPGCPERTCPEQIWPFSAEQLKKRQGWQASLHCTGFTHHHKWLRTAARAYLPAQCSGVQNERVRQRLQAGLVLSVGHRCDGPLVG